MKFLRAYLFILPLITFYSCIKHEVIPPPEHKAALKAYFNGSVNNVNLELTESVNGYAGKGTQSKVVLPAGQTSSCVYLFDMSSNQSPVKMQIGMGSLTWDQASATGPTLTSFNNFFNASAFPAYSNNGSAGFYVSYTDAGGNIWMSKQASKYAQTVNFTSIAQESDPNGDYSKFTCTFSCRVYRSLGGVPVVEDSLLIQNAQFKGWFQR